MIRPDRQSSSFAAFCSPLLVMSLEKRQRQLIWNEGSQYERRDDFFYLFCCKERRSGIADVASRVGAPRTSCRGGRALRWPGERAGSASELWRHNSDATGEEHVFRLNFRGRRGKTCRRAPRTPFGRSGPRLFLRRRVLRERDCKRPLANCLGTEVIARRGTGFCLLHYWLFFA